MCTRSDLLESPGTTESTSISDDMLSWCSTGEREASDRVIFRQAIDYLLVVSIYLSMLGDKGESKRLMEMDE